MKKMLVPAAIIGLMVVTQYIPVLAVKAASVPSNDQEIVKALNIQNQQLKRIADSLEIISGEQPGWKLPK